MTQKTIRPSDRAAVVGVIDPDVLTAAAHSSGWIDMTRWQEIMAIVQVGTLGTNATVDAKIEQATDGSGTGVKDVTGAAITQLTQAGTDESDKQAIINLFAEDLDADNDFTHARLTITVGTASSDGGGIVLGMCPRHESANENDLASVAEIVSL